MPSLAEAGELAVLDALRPYLAAAGGGLDVGAGDDAAVWRPPAGRSVVVTTDSLVEGVHFLAAGDEEFMLDLGWKLLAVSLSDLAAMAAAPGPAFLSLALPRAWELSQVEALYRGLAACAHAHGAQLAGGNLATAALAVLTSTCLGTVDPALALRRAPVEPGWALAVTGTLGGAAAAVRLAGEARGSGEPGTAAAWRVRLRRPEPRLAAAAVLVEAGVRTALDVSDGVFLDAARLLPGGARGCVIDAESLPVDDGIRERWPAAWAAVAGGGEDYELLFAGPPDVVDVAVAALASTGLGATVIGTFDSGDGLRLRSGGVEKAPPSGGYQHFA